VQDSDFQCKAPMWDFSVLHCYDFTWLWHHNIFYVVHIELNCCKFFCLKFQLSIFFGVYYIMLF
jgi:hypothetical protein